MLTLSQAIVVGVLGWLIWLLATPLKKGAKLSDLILYIDGHALLIIVNFVGAALAFYLWATAGLPMFGWEAGEFNYAVAGLGYLVPALLENLAGVGAYVIDKINHGGGK